MYGVNSHDVIGFLKLLEGFDGFFTVKGTAAAVSNLLVDSSNDGIQAS